MKKVYFFVCMLLCSAVSWGQVSLTNGSPSVLIDFSNTMPTGVGSNPATAFTGAGFEAGTTTAGRLNSNAWATTGWSDGALAFGGTNTAGDHARGSVSVAQSTGGMYAYTGAPGSAANPALMIQPGGSDWAPGTLTLRIQNNGSTNLTQLAVSYNIYIRNDQARSNSFNFSYSSDNTTYTAVGALDYTSTAAADALGWVLVGSAPSRSTTITGLAIAPGGYVYIRWSGADVGGSGSRDEFGLDDINLTATFSSGGTPDITLSSPSPAVAAGNITQGTTNNAIYRFDLAVTSADAVLNGVTINTAGTYAASDITNFKCWYSSDATFSPGSDVLLSTNSSPGAAGAQVFPSFTNQLIANGTTGYIFISADIPCGAVATNDISVNAITTADISFTSGNKSGSASAGGLQTIIAATPNNVTAPAASVGNTNSSLSWTNPAGCYDEVLIVARATTANDGVPSGDGSAYTGDLVFGSGTALGSGFVVYKGTSSPQVVTGLTNGTPYFYKFFTRKGTTWTSGVEVSATPASVTNATDYFRTVGSGSWGTLGIWQSSADSSTWAASTLIPGASAAHVVIQSPDSVWLTTDRTTANLTIMSGGKFNAAASVMTASTRFNLLGTASFYQGGGTTSVPGVQQVLSATSNYHYNGTQAGTSATLPEFGNLFWEPTPSGGGTLQNNASGAPFNNGLVVRGNMTINIQGGTAREIRFATGSAVSRTHTIDGDLNIISNASQVVVQNGTAAVTSIVNVGGNINVSAGILQGTSSSTGTDGNATVNVKGNVNNTGGTVQTGASTAGVFNLNFTGTGAQSINNSGGTYTFTAKQNMTVNKSTGAFTANIPVTLGTLNLTNGIFTVGSNNITVNIINGGSSTSYIKTNGSGSVTLNNISEAILPVGNAKYNPIFIENGSGHNWSVKVTDGVTADPGLNTNKAVLVTWDITPSVNPPNAPADITFQFDETSQVGPLFTAAENVQAWHFTSHWNPEGAPAAAFDLPATRQVKITGLTHFSPYALSNVSGPLPVLINYLDGIKQGSNHNLSWKVTCSNTPGVNMVIERSTDGRSYTGIYNMDATALQCQQPFSLLVTQTAAGMNYYRLKVTDVNGKVTYSNIIALLNKQSGFDILSLMPNPVSANGITAMNVTAAQAGTLQIRITDFAGRTVMTQTENLPAGSRLVPLNLGRLSTGTYILTAYYSDGTSKTMRIAKQ